MRGIPVLKYLTAVPRIRRASRQADVVHSHFGYCGWLTWTATRAMRNRPRLVMSFMGDDLLGTPRSDGSLYFRSRAEAAMNAKFARLFDRVIVKSREMANVIAPCECTVVPNGVDMDTFLPRPKEEARRELNLPLDRKLALFPGDPANPRKGHQLAKESVESAQRLLGDQIELVPLCNIDPSKVATYMNACDVMLMMSFIEGSPNVVKEGLACNLPIIGVVVGDVPEMLDGIEGCAVCPRDADAIARKLVDIVKENHSCNGREILLQRGLDLRNVALRVLSVYESALGADRSSPN